MSKPTVLIAIDTNAETANEAFGRSFIQSLCDQDARLVPEKLSTTENYKDPFLGIDDFLANWWSIPEEVRVDGHFSRAAIQGPSWKRKSALASRGNVSHGFINQKNMKIPSRIWFESRWAKGVDFNQLFEAWVGLSHSEIGMLHLFTEVEKELLQSEGGAWFGTGTFGGPAKLGLPNIGWAMAYGGHYADEVDVARIRAAGFLVEERDGVTIVRVTDKLSDVVDNFALFSKRRGELKALFRPGLFWMQDEPALI